LYVFKKWHILPINDTNKTYPVHDYAIRAPIIGTKTSHVMAQIDQNQPHTHE